MMPASPLLPIGLRFVAASLIRRLSSIAEDIEGSLSRLAVKVTGCRCDHDDADACWRDGIGHDRPCDCACHKFLARRARP